MPRRLITLTVLGAIALAGCGADRPADPAESPAPADTTTPELSGSLAHLVPEALRGTTVTLGYQSEERPPHIVRGEDESWAGPLTEVVRGALDRLGLTATDVEVPDAANPVEDLAAGAYTVLMSPTAPGEYVYENADAISYLVQNEVFLARAGVELGSEFTDLCGLRIGFTDAGDSSDQLQGYLAEGTALCASRDLPPLQPVPFEAESDGPIDAVIRGEVDAVPTVDVYASYLIDQNPELSIGGPARESSTTVFLVGKDSPLTAPLVEAVNAIIADGTYEAIMAGYELPARPPSPAAVNPPLE